MSCGLPVVASDEGGLPELVAHGEGGFVCRSGDLAAFVTAMLQLLDQPELRRRFGAFNRERVDRHFRWPRAARRVLDIYEEIIGDWKRGMRRA
jgi:phosphatidylinositol alpha-1,6-mannosyltransferase